MNPSRTFLRLVEIGLLGQFLTLFLGTTRSLKLHFSIECSQLHEDEWGYTGLTINFNIIEDGGE